MQSVQKSANFSAFGHLARPELQPGGDFLSGLLLQFPLTRCRFCIFRLSRSFFSIDFFVFVLWIFPFYTSNCHGPWQRQESWRWRNHKWRKSFHGSRRRVSPPRAAAPPSISPPTRWSSSSSSSSTSSCRLQPCYSTPCQVVSPLSPLQYIPQNDFLEIC